MMKHIQELRDLRILKALLQDPHVSRCAVQMNMTQSAVSHSLKRLRMFYGDPLLVKSGKGFEATTFLLSLESKLTRFLDIAKDIGTHSIEFDPATSHQAFDIAMPEHVSVSFIPKLLKNIRHTAPNIVLNFKAAHPKEASGLLQNGQIDLYVGSLRHINDSLKTQHLYDDQFICLARRGYPIFQNGKLTQAAYKNARHLKLSLQGRQPSYIDESLLEFGVVRKSILTVPYYLLGFEMILHEDALMTVQKTMADHVLSTHNIGRDIQTAPCPYPVDDFPISQFWHARSDHDPAHQWLRQTIFNTARIK